MFDTTKTEKLYLWLIKIPIFLIPLIPLYISPSMVFPYITGKNFAFRILVEFAAALWLGLIAIKERYRPNNSAITISVLIFTFIVGLADLLGVNPYKSFWSNYERMEGYITVLHLALYFMIIKSVLRSNKDWRMFLNIFIAVSVLVGLYSFGFHITEISEKLPGNALASARYAMIYGTRLHGSIGNPPFLASYLLLSVFLGLILICRTQKFIYKFIYILTALFNSIIIYYTSSRGAILAGILGIIATLFFYITNKSYISKRKLLKIIVLLSIGFIVVLISVFWAYSNIDNIKHDNTFYRFTTMFSDDSFKSRLDAWKMGWGGIKKRPLLGWGQENFIGTYSVNHIPFVGVQLWQDRAHNIVVDWLVSAGILGLLSYLAMFALTFNSLWKTHRLKCILRIEALTITTFFSVYLIQNLFTFDTINTYIIIFSLIGYVDNLTTEKEKNYENLKNRNDLQKTNIKILVMTFLMVWIFAITFFYVNYKPLKQAQKAALISTSTSKYDSFSALLDDFNRALSYRSFGYNDIVQRMVQVSYSILKGELFNQEGAIKFIESTARELEHGIATNPYDLEYLTSVINLYQKIAVHQPQFAIRTESLIREYLILYPQFEWLYFSLADTYKLNKEYEKAFEIVNEMVDFDAHDDQKQLQLALAAIPVKKEGIVQHALDKIRKIRRGNNIDIESGNLKGIESSELYLIAKAYIDIRDFKIALEYLKKRVERDPDDARAHYDLVNVYLKLGDKKSAIKEAKKAAELEPESFSVKIVGLENSIE